MKKTVIDNWRVEVHPVDLDGLKAKKECERIKSEILRHVDDVEDARKSMVFYSAVSIEHDTKVVCEFCGYPWCDDTSVQPDCCEKANQEWEANARGKDIGLAVEALAKDIHAIAEGSNGNQS